MPAPEICLDSRIHKRSGCIGCWKDCKHSLVNRAMERVKHLPLSPAPKAEAQNPQKLPTGIKKTLK